MLAELLLVLVVIGLAVRELYILRKLKQQREDAERAKKSDTT